MSSTATEKQRVYLACKPIFAGNNTLLRKRKAIQKHITDHSHSLTSLIPGFDVNNVTTIAKALLEKQVFESDIKAKLEFPDLFVSSSSRDTQHGVSELEAARSAAEALEGISSAGEEEEDQKPERPPTQSPVQKTTTSVETKVQVDREKTLSAPGLSIASPSPAPSLYPIYLPYCAQHSVLCTLQRVLEECCFDFAKKWLPAEVERNQCDCAAAVELTTWLRLLVHWLPQLPDGSLQIGGSCSNFDDLIPTIRKIRHTAVHRLPTTAREIDSLVVASLKFAETLQDTLRTSQLEDLHWDVQNKIKAMELNKNALEVNLVRELRAISQQREELDRKEKELKATTLNNDRENKSLVGLLVEESVGRIFNGQEKENPLAYATADEGEED